MDAKDEAERGLTVIQDYLYWDSHRRAAHRRAAEFAAHVPGLSEGQKTDLEWWYVEEQIRVSRAIAHHLTDQITMVEARHTRRYARLRRTSGVVLAVLTVTVIALLVSLVLVAAG
ncbi:hypothetical protein G3I36_17205 [Streptomyces sp. SID10362]|uniref:hypothetical protein n=1 Tax=Streptomyces sp. SID10362 TaxID=2706021 RepID=UPI0013C7D33F|nr:hypothetical protein [Streptomyces sp. SID10362]NDZ72775.1 hypothetical protein [Streptomyces sp. SID10362]